MSVLYGWSGERERRRGLGFGGFGGVGGDIVHYCCCCCCGELGDWVEGAVVWPLRRAVEMDCVE